MKIVRGENHVYLLEFSSTDEFETFFNAADLEGSFSLDIPNIPASATFRATASGSLRSRRIKPLKITQEPNGARILLTEKEKQAAAGVSEPSLSAVPTTAEQIRGLTVTEKAMLAMKCGLAERRVLMQENNPKIQEFLLRNPRLTESEIAWMAKNPMSAIPTLLTILRHKEWMSADAIRQGIYTNPKTPAHIVLDKIPSLSAADLIKMYHAKNLREDIRDAVSRQIKKRGIRISAIRD